MSAEEAMIDWVFQIINIYEILTNRIFQECFLRAERARQPTGDVAHFSWLERLLDHPVALNLANLRFFSPALPINLQSRLAHARLALLVPIF